MNSFFLIKKVLLPLGSLRIVARIKLTFAFKTGKIAVEKTKKVSRFSSCIELFMVETNQKWLINLPLNEELNSTEKV